MSLNAKDLFNLFASLTPAEKEQFQVLIASNTSSDLLESIASERTKTGLICPHCGNVHVVRNGTLHGKQRYVCRVCSRSFMDTTNSILASAKLDTTKIKALFSCMIHKESVRDTANMVGINRNTAFLWRHKVLDAISKEQAILSGIVEADETFFRISYKGNHAHDGFQMPRKSKHRGTRA